MANESLTKLERISNGIKTVSPEMVLGKLDHDTQKNEPGPFSYTTHKNSKWMKDLNVRQEAIKMLKEKADKNLSDLGRSNFLLNMSLEARETKAKMN